MSNGTVTYPPGVQGYAESGITYRPEAGDDDDAALDEFDKGAENKGTDVIKDPQDRSPPPELLKQVPTTLRHDFPIKAQRLNIGSATRQSLFSTIRVYLKYKRHRIERMESKSYKPFVRELSKRVTKGYVVAKDERKELKRLGLEARGLFDDVGDILSQSTINSLPPPSESRIPDLYVVRFATRDERRRAKYVAADHGPVSLLRNRLTIGLTNERQRDAIEQADITYEIVSR